MDEPGHSREPQPGFGPENDTLPNYDDGEEMFSSDPKACQPLTVEPKTNFTWGEGAVSSEHSPHADSIDSTEKVSTEELREMRLRELQELCRKSRRGMVEDPDYGLHRAANRYGNEAELPVFEEGRHVPVLGLINPSSGAMAGHDILRITREHPYYQYRFFNIIDVVKGQMRGGLMDVFRGELNAARDEAKAMGTRARLVSAGGDGTCSFAIFIILLALRANPERAEEGLEGHPNGFLWTDKELEESFPALAQLPLGSANDFGNITGWGQKYPGDGPACCASTEKAARALFRWFSCVIDKGSTVCNFDIWGIMPQAGSDKCDFKIAELYGRRGPCPNRKVDGRKHIHLKEAGKPVPFYICLYFSAGFGPYMTARFQLNRRETPLKNRIEYVKQALGIITETTPPQMNLRLNDVEIDCQGEPYFPPRRHRGTKGRGYREVGFYNINWQAAALHGGDRAGLGSRLCSTRTPVKFNDGQMDMFRWKFLSLMKNPGLRIQTDKKRDMCLTYSGSRGKGFFFQWDGEARFAFSPSGEPFHLYVRRILNIPIVIGPFHNSKLTGPLDNGKEVRFSFAGDTDAERELVRERILKHVRGDLDSELNATREEILAAELRLHEDRISEASSAASPRSEGKEEEPQSF